MAKQTPKKDPIESLRKENARLEAEVARLRTIAPAEPTSSQPHITSRFLRRTAVVICMVLAVLLVVLGNLFFWVGNTLVSNNRFVAATAPVIQNTQVQQTLALYTTNQIFASVNVQQIVTQALPPRAAFLAPQLTGQIRGFAQQSAQKVLATPKFQQTWNSVIAKQHARIVQFAKNYQGNGTISLNDIVQHLTASLSDTKLSFLQGKQLPKNIGSITVVTASWLPALHTLVNNIGTWRVLSILGLVIFTALAIWLSRNRRHTIFYLCLFSVLGLLGSLVILRIVRQRIIDNVQGAYQAGATRAIQIIAHSFLVQTLTIIVAVIILGLITWISGNSSSAGVTKRYIRSLFTDKLHTLFFDEENVVTSWVGKYQRMLEWVTIGIFILLMLSLRLTAKTLTLLVVLLAIVILAIEIMSNQARKQSGAKT